MAIACRWEQKLLDEMTRLTNELNQIHGEERHQAVEETRLECLKQIEELQIKHEKVERELREEISSLKTALDNKTRRLEEANTAADNQRIQTRIFLDKQDKQHQLAMDNEIRYREECIRK